MGMVYADIELVNGEDIAMSRRHIIGQEEIRSMRVNMMVDTGSEYMCINEMIQEQLGLPTVERRSFQLANGKVEEYAVAGPVEIRFANRRFYTEAIVLPGDTQMLLGAIAMEGMDVVVNPSRRELTVHPDHPYVAQMNLRGIRKR